MRHRIASLVVCAWVLSLGCGSEDDEAPIELLAGTVVVHADVRTTRYSEVAIADVERLGDSIVVLVTTKEVVNVDIFSGPVISTTPSYFVSDDRGDSWREVEIAPFSSDDSYPPLVGPTGGLFVFDGALYELVPWYVERALDNYPTLLIYALDLATGTRRGIASLEASYFYLDENGISGNFYNSYWASWDPATGQENARVEVPYSPDGWGVSCSSRRFNEGSAVPGARTMRQTCEIDYPGEETRWCESRTMPPVDFDATSLCFSASEWPIDASQRYTLMHGPEGLIVTTGQSGESQVSSLAVFDPSGVRLVPSGPGAPQRRYRDDIGDHALEQDRYAGLIPLVEFSEGDIATTTLYTRTGPATFSETPFPTRPCPDGAPCGYRPLTTSGTHIDSVLQWIEPIGLGESLIFYVVDRGLPSTGFSRNVIYVRRTSAPAAPESPAISNELTDACGLASSCFADRAFSMVDCMYQMSWIANTERYAALLAATDCEAVRPLFPDYNWTPCSEVSSVCDGSRLVMCDGERYYEQDCSQVGASCSVVDGYANCVPDEEPCRTFSCLENGDIDACGVVTPCGPGAACLATEGSARCATIEPNCRGGGGICVGDQTVICEAEGFGYANADCSRLPGMQCFSGQCAPSSNPASCNFSRCDGDRLVFCDSFFSVPIEVDCAAFGLDCVADENSWPGACR